jgi:hypothetical protein
MAGFLYSDRAPECMDVAHFWSDAGPGFFWGLTDSFMIRVIIKVGSIYQSVGPEFHSKVGSLQHASQYVGKSSMRSLSTAVL